jgi:hypothetical protein
MWDSQACVLFHNPPFTVKDSATTAVSLVERTVARVRAAAKNKVMNIDPRY